MLIFQDGISDKNCLGDALGGELGGALAVAEASSTAMASSPPASGEGEPTMAFYLMTRKGNKAQFKNLAVPTDSELAQNLRNREMVKHFFFVLEFQNLNLIILIFLELIKKVSLESVLMT